MQKPVLCPRAWQACLDWFAAGRPNRAILGAVGGILLRNARLRGWSSEEFAGAKLADLRPERAQLRERFQRRNIGK
jgi:hypothetical protein